MIKPVIKNIQPKKLNRYVNSIERPGIPLLKLFVLHARDDSSQKVIETPKIIKYTRRFKILVEILSLLSLVAKFEIEL